MKLNIKDIREGGRSVEYRLGDAELRCLLESGAASRPNSSLKLESGESHACLTALLHRRGDTVFLRGGLVGRYWITCSRCLGPAAIDVANAELRLTFLPPQVIPSGDVDRELEVDDLDTFAHDGVEIDLAALVREYLVLEVPIAPRCGENCTGLTTGGDSLSVQATVPATGQSHWKGALQAIKSELSPDVGEEPN